MVMCTLGRNFNAGALHRKLNPWTPPDWVYGGLKRRLRETAMAVQIVGSYRMQKGGHPVVIDSADAIYMFEDLESIEDRITRGVFKLQDESGCCWLRPGTGVFPGDTGATLLFVRSFSQPVMQHVADQFCAHGRHVAVEARLPWDEHGVDARQVALTGSVDDIANK
eukprot:9499068-Pyramimonas_sp.AAC.1